MQWNYELIPTLVMEALIEYRDTGRPVGSFTQAVLSNNLYEACKRGDEQSLAALPTIVAWIANYMPASAWGTPGSYMTWLRLFQAHENMGHREVRYHHDTGKFTYQEAEEATSVRPEVF